LFKRQPVLSVEVKDSSIMDTTLSFTMFKVVSWKHLTNY